MTTDKNKQTQADLALREAIKEIEKHCGEGSIMRLGDSQPPKIDVISSGSLILDSILGIGGYPKGRVVEIFGPESSGKTTIALHCVAEAQKAGGLAAFIDAEHALDVTYAKAIGVDVENLLLSQPDSGEQALNIAEKLISSGSIDVVVIDSVAALTPEAELKGDMTDIQPGLQARLMSKGLRKLTAHAAKYNCLVIFINQIRHKIGIMFGNPETTTGGNALKFYSSVRLDIRRASIVKEGDKAVGNQVRIRVVKNKMAPPFGQAEIYMSYSDGISLYSEVLDMSVEKELVVKSGSWYSYKGDKMGQGKDQAVKFLQENPEIFKYLEDQIRNGK